MENKNLVPPGMSYLADNISRKDNLLGVDKKEGAKWAKGLNLSKNGEVISSPAAVINLIPNWSP